MTRNPSETTLLYRNGRRARCKECGMPPHGGHVRQATRINGWANPDGSGHGNWAETPSPDGPSILELVAGVLILLVNFLALFYALPILVEAVMR